MMVKRNCGKRPDLRRVVVRERVGSVGILVGLFCGICYEGLGKELQCELRICYVCALILKG